MTSADEEHAPNRHDMRNNAVIGLIIIIKFIAAQNKAAKVTYFFSLQKYTFYTSNQKYALFFYIFLNYPNYPPIVMDNCRILCNFAPVF